MGIKRGKQSKTDKKYEFFERFARFLQAIRSNHKQITHIAPCQGIICFKAVETEYSREVEYVYSKEKAW